MTRIRLWAAIAVLLAASPLFALNPGLSIGQYLHTSWTQEEGSALPPIQALAQTSDGYLWLATSHGLMRFDGLRFVQWTPVSGPSLPSPDIRCLRSAAGGGLWVGTAAGIGRVDHDRVVRYPAANKLPCGPISSMLEDRAGRLWILDACPTNNVVAVFEADGSFKTFGAADGLPEQVIRIRTLFEDRQSNLWIGTSNGICRWSPGSPAACPKGLSLDAFSLAESPESGLVVWDARKKQLFSTGQEKAVSPRMPESSLPGVMLRDRDGNIWVGTAGQGLLRIHAGIVDRFTRKDGLSSNLVQGLLEDREGDLWVATARGLDRFRDPKVLLLSTLDGLSGDLTVAVSGDRDGAVWVGTAGGGLDRVEGKRVRQYNRTEGLPNPIVLSLGEDASSRLWVGTSDGLAVRSGDRFAEVLTVDGEHLNRVFNISCGPQGAVWLADSVRGLFTIRGGVAYPVAQPEIESRDIYRLLAARNGAVWAGDYRGGVWVINQNPPKRYDTRDGLASGPVQAIYEDREGAIWAGTRDGLSRFRDGRWTTWTTAQGLPEGGVQGIVGDGGDGLWLVTSLGLLRLSRGSLNGPVKTLPYILYGATEGLRLAHGGALTNPRITRARDGRLWLCSEDGVAVIDPARVRSNPVAPGVVIEQLTVDGEGLEIPSRGEAAFRGNDIQVTFAGISLMVPERVRIRYRMDGLDKDWKEAGARRSVSYVNLPPRSYRFRVIAANNDGLWNNTGAEMDLRIEPYFYQTRWFAAACLMSALLLAWGVHWLKMRQVISRFRLVAAERARFSRELHDSLLQGFLGVVYQLQAASRQFQSAPAASKQRLDRALEQADQSLREARQMITSMRIPALENNTLPEALTSTLAQVVSGIPVDFQFEVKGRVRQYHYDVEANAFLIAREAVTNSLSHAAATRIRVELGYTARELRLSIQDDGVGFDPEMALAKAGHWGFRGMRERARQMGATFAVESAPGRGSRIDVAVPWKE